MVNVRKLDMWNMSVSMLIGKSPKISYVCGKCGMYNKARISTNAIKMGSPYVVCEHCGEVNNTMLKF
jgi:DNA-directed RNA polymerase subunit RPC12/RpoP